MRKKTVWFTIPLAIIVLVLFTSLLITVGAPLMPFAEKRCDCHYMLPNSFYLIFGILLIAATILVSHYLNWRKTAEKLDRQLELISRLTSTNQRENKTALGQSFLKLLNDTERKILEKLKENGPMLQSEISRMDGMTKLKAHRTLKGLYQKGVIHTERHGKTNKISVTESAEDLFRPS